MKRKFEFSPCPGVKHTVTLHKDSYALDGTLAVVMKCWDDGYPEQFDVLTTNLDSPLASECRAFVQTDEYLDWIVENGIGEKTDIFETSGFNVYELIKFNTEMLEDNNGD